MTQPHARRLLTTTILFFWLPAAGAHAVPLVCGGDCNHDRHLSIDELVTGVGIALERATVDTCAALDANNDAAVTVEELIGAVRAALDGCPRPVFAEAACPIPLPAGQPAGQMRCGTVELPEDWQHPYDGRSVRLAVAVLQTTDPGKPHLPLVILDGGPGGPTLDALLPYFTADFAAPLQAQHDLVFFDQRGGGRSQPGLYCPEADAAYALLIGETLPARQDVARINDALRQCYDRLRAAGHNLAAYHSAAIALDAGDVAAALGHDQFDLYGLSYGTRIAQSAMRDTPQRLHRVVLDSAVPVAGRADPVTSFEQSLDRLLADCHADSACDAAYPDLEQQVYEVYDRLNAAPITLHPPHPVTGVPTALGVTGDRLVFETASGLSATDSIPNIPFLTAANAAGDYAPFEAGAGYFLLRAPTADGAANSIVCGDTPHAAPTARQTGGDPRQVLRDAIAVYSGLDAPICDFWHSRQAPAREAQAVVSDIPTLILSGDYDPNTPLSNALLVAQTLSNSLVLQLRGVGHVVMLPTSAEPARGRCAVQVVSQFLAGEVVDAACVDALPPVHFVLP